MLPDSRVADHETGESSEGRHHKFSVNGSGLDDPEKARKLGREYDVARTVAYDSYDELIRAARAGR
jgi:hypothetical protein